MYKIRNLNDSIDRVKKKIISQDELFASLNSFSTPQNLDVENFLKKSSVEFTKKGQSVTYLVYESVSSKLVGYYSLTIKPLAISLNGFSKEAIKRFLRLSDIDQEENTITIPAYLIAQLGKNYSIPKNARIDGKILLAHAYATIFQLKREIGGIATYLECEENPFLLDFYISTGHKNIGIRKTAKGQVLCQFLKFI